MIQISEKENCCGCTACMSVCAHHAITMELDNLGFKYPVVNEALCVNCGLCESVCAFNDLYDKTKNLDTPEIYAVRHKQIHEIEKSRSGAAFIALSDWIIENGGVVYGAGYTDHFRVVHKRATSKEERDEFRGSKYVQSDLTNTFKKVREDLKQGLYVLFSGTPCQTAGLRSYIGKKLSGKFYLVDIICHGVPSPSVWKDYISYTEIKERHRIVKVNFRDKKFGWRAHRESFVFDNGEEKNYDIYTYLFYQHIILRKSCGSCYYTNLQRPSDITIGDFWGWEKTDQNFNIDDKGCSLLFCNTKKGRDLFNSKREDLNSIPVNIGDCLQPNLQHPSILNSKMNSFENDYIKKGFGYVLYRYGNLGVRYKYRRIYHNMHFKCIHTAKTILNIILRKK